MLCIVFFVLPTFQKLQLSKWELSILYKILFTHPYWSAVAWQAAAQEVIGDDMNSVHLTTVQVIPCAAGGVCGAHVDMVILSLCNDQVGLCPVAVAPAGRAQIVLTVCKALYILRDAGAWGKGELLNHHKPTVHFMRQKYQWDSYLSWIFQANSRHCHNGHVLLLRWR